MQKNQWNMMKICIGGHGVEEKKRERSKEDDK